MLLCRPAKRNLTIIGMVAGWSLVMEFLDMYWVVMPVHYPNGPQIALAGFRDAGGDGQHLRSAVLEPLPQAQDGSGGRPAAASRV